MAIQYGGPSIGAAHIPFTAPKPPPLRRPPPVVPPVRHPSLTAPQVANQQVNQALAPQISAQNAFNQRQNQAITAFANALLGKLTPLAGQVGQTYDQAIGQTAALSNQSAQFLQNANPSPQVQALLQSAGAPQAQQDQVTQALGGTFGGGAGVLSFLGGAVPGGQLAADKAAVVGQTAQLPGIAALQGEQSLASALGTQADARNQLLATRPGLYQTALQNIRENQGARAKLNQDARQNQFENNLAVQKVNIGVQEFNAGQRAKAAGVRAATASAAAKLAEAKREFRVKRSDAATAAVAKATAADKAAQVKAKQAFFTWFTGTKQTYDDKTITEIAKDVFGIDVSGLSTTAPPPKPVTPKSVSPGSTLVDPATGKVIYKAPPRPTAAHYTTIHDSTGQYVVNETTGEKTKVGAPLPAGSTGGRIVGSDKSGRYYYDPTTGKKTLITPPVNTSTSSGPKLNTTASGRYGVQIDEAGNPILRNGHTVPYPKTTGGASSTSGARTQKLIATIDAGLENAVNGFDGKDINGKVQHHPALDRAGAIAELEKHGYFATPELKKLAMARLNKYYPQHPAAYDFNKFPGSGVPPGG